ncbi:fibronectin type III domain-containing protein [Campylobacter sp. RM12327]|uniref:fibronectin type III domain-containing protein n=1 Tax=Campylobacter sputorum TaxID=206 RepID=UPI000B784EA0|nr:MULTISPECIES: fibronectin type III domain-containing protein [Campylobacter]ASM40238.1 fibronectin type III domain-containing protein [Campylobacter sputorum]MBE7358526.1 fibronectin type III domain-containing protein [Campylobacter sp. RM11302]MBF6669769.1 fibronectin type III domain-containing protein [Campylobacter sp. RM12327]MBF6674943.1 fibronectin type III domain-containing protein [Campylobacter sp. RM13538]MBF6676357.1 fibronectin type III domain-containing protein [Campylobacter s
MKICKYLISGICFAIFLNGCATKLPNSTNPNLPIVENIKTISDMTEIAFEWSSLGSNENIEGFYLYRKDSNSNSFNIVANIKDRYATHYVDTKLSPEITYDYMMKSYDVSNNASRQSEIVSVRTQNLIESVPFAQTIQGLPDRVKVLWRPHPDLRVDSYIIERSEVGSSSWKQIAEIKGRLNAEYIDKKVDAGRSYKYRISVKTTSGIISRPSEIFNAQTKPKPYPVTGLNATNSEPKKIVLNWDANTNEDFSHYNVYAKSSKFLPYKLIATTKTNSYTDLVNENGATKTYVVTAVDTTDLESDKQIQGVVGSTLSAPKSPVFTRADYTGGAVMLAWDPKDDKTVSYVLKKSSSDKESSFELSDTTYADSDLTIGETYKYKIIGIDEYGINSQESDEVTILAK